MYCETMIRTPNATFELEVEWWIVSLVQWALMSQTCFESLCPQWNWNCFLKRITLILESMAVVWCFSIKQNAHTSHTNTVFYVAMVLLIFLKYPLFVTLLWNCIRTPVLQWVNELSHKTECHCTAHIKLTLLKCGRQLQTFHFDSCKLAFEAHICNCFNILMA